MWSEGEREDFALFPSSLKVGMPGVHTEEAPPGQLCSENPCALRDGLGAGQTARCVDNISFPSVGLRTGVIMATFRNYR